MRRETRRWRTATLASLLLAQSVVVLIGTRPAAGATIQAFNDRFAENANGAIAIFGNGLLTCRTGDVVAKRTCADVRAGTASGDLNNNSWVMVNVDADGTAFSTYNSSSAVATFPSGDSVLWAGLYWGARLSKGTNGAAAPSGRDKMLLRGPGDTIYRSITSQDEFGPTSGSGQAYQQFAEVTEIVQDLGPGTYWGANVAAATGEDRYAGWALVIVYQDPTLPLRNLTVFDGFAEVGDDDSQEVDVEGFLTPLEGTVDVQLGMVAYEGDQGTTGDTAFLEGTRLGTNASPGTNFFNSTNDRNGVVVVDGNRGDRNLLGFDLKALGAPDVIDNDVEAATFEFSSTGDVYFPGVLTTTINLYAPDFTPSTKQVVNLDGNDPARPGDTLEYTLAYVNSGADPAESAVADDPLPVGVTFVPGSLEVVSGDDPGPKTDAAGDDEAEYLAGTRTVRFRVGAGATATSGGTVAAEGGSTDVRFRVTVDDVDARITVTNRAELDYVPATIGGSLTYIGNEVTTVIQPVADLRVAKSTTPDPAIAGDTFTSTITVANDGPNTARQVTATDFIPEGTSFVSADASQGSCTEDSGTVTCSLGSLTSGSSATITVVAGLAADSVATAVTNIATVASAVTPDPDETDNSTTATAGVTRQADLVVEKVPLDADVVPGTTTTFQITVRNDGPSDAVDLVLDDTLAPGLTIVGSTVPPGVTCEPKPDGFRCLADRLAAGAEVTGTLEALVASNYTAATAGNVATIGSSTTDPDTADNSVTAEVPVAPPESDVEVTKTADPVTPIAGGQVTFSLAYVNHGPSDATGVVVEDDLPTGLTVLSVSSNRGTCTEGPPVSCDIGTLPVGAGGEVTVVAAIDSDVLGPVANTATIGADSTDPTPANNTSTTTPEVIGSADLGVSKQGAPNPVAAGSSVTYTVTVGNDGPSTARDVSITDTLPTGFTYVAGSATPSQGSCTEPSGGILDCAFGDLLDDATASVTFSMSVPSDFTGSDINAVTVDSTTDDPVDDNNTAEALSSTTSTADVFVTKQTDQEPLTAGAQFSYEIVVGNSGPSTAIDVLVIDRLPPGVVAESAGRCVVSEEEVTCTVGNLPPGSITLTIPATVAADVPDGALLTNIAEASSVTPDRDSSNNTAVLTNTVVAAADLNVTKSIDPASGVEGTFTTFTMTVTNSGPSQARDVTFVDVFEWFDTGVAQFTVDGVPVECVLQPDGTTTCTLPSNPAFFCLGLVTGELECDLGNLDPGEEVVLELVVALVNAPPIADFLNTVTVATTTPDPDLDNNTAEATYAITGYSADLEITKTAPGELVAGAEFSYQITWQNNGTSTAFDVAIEDTLPDELIPASVTPTTGTCDLADQTFTCQVGDTPWIVVGGFTGSIVVTGTVAADATGLIANTATISSPISDDPEPGNNSSTASSTVLRSADLSVIKTASADTAAGGGTITYFIGALNEGPSTAEDVMVEETLPAGVVDFSFDDPRCTVVAGPAISCTYGTLQPGEDTGTFIDITFASDFEGDATDTATASSDTPDPDSDDLVIELTTPVVRTADLRVTKTPVAPTAVAGGQLTYTIVLANNGPSSAAEVVLTDQIPDGTTLVSTATEPEIDCDQTVDSVICSVGTLEPGTSQSLVVTVALATDLPPGALANTASADSPTDDPDPGARVATATVEVTVEADLQITKTTLTNPVVAGQPVTYGLEVVNQGPSAAPDVLISDTLPDGTTFVSSTTSQGSCVVEEAEAGLDIASCALGQLAPGATASATITFDTDIGLSGVLTNVAVVGSGALDPNDEDNTSEVNDDVEVPADLSIEKSGPAVVAAGGTATYILTYRNDGPATATGVVVIDELPTDVTVVTAPGCTVAGAVVTCAVGTVEAGEEGTIEVTVQVDNGLAEGTDLTDVASIDGDQIDGDTGNDDASFTSTVGAALNATVTVVADREVTTAGGPGGYEVMVTNEGPLTATGVQVEVTLPTQLEELMADTSLVFAAGPQLAQVDIASCDVDGVLVTCEIGTLGVGETSSVTLSGTVASGTPDGTQLVASAAVTVAEPDTDPTDDTDRDIILVVSAQPPPTVPPGLPFTGAALVGLLMLSLVLVVGGVGLRALGRGSRSRRD